MTSRVAGKSIIVTGSTWGIGRGCALALAGEGARVVITGPDAEDEPGRSALAEIRSAGGEAIALIQDVREEASWRHVLERTQEAFGRIDAVINNAGRAILKPIEEMTLDDVRFELTLNLEGCFLGTRFALERLNAGGVVLNMSSVAALRGSVGSTAYGPSKAAILAFTRAAAQEAIRDARGIRVNAILPGLIWGPTVVMKLGAEKANAMREQAIARSPLKCVGDPADIAHLAVFLCSDAARGINGATLVVDGGATI
ncbi:MAG: SDR family oxidoreductase [Alphaproteobacteria bacterium]|nr:SDR family oxidoreductase [Alphaproteobacteria bacterium]